MARNSRISIPTLLRIIGIIGSSVLITSGTLAAYYSGQAKMTEFVEMKEDILKKYSDENIERLEKKIEPKLNKILEIIIKQTEDTAKIKGKLNIN